MSKTQEALKLALEALENNKQTHHYCEDTWYSCPKHEDGCANEAEGDECNCGADKANAEIEKAITAIREALAEQPAPVAEPHEQQEPVAVMTVLHLQDRTEIGYGPASAGYDLPTGEYKLYTSPPAQQQEPVAWMDAEGDVYKQEPPDGWCPPHTPLYTSPSASKPWVGLTDEKINVIWHDIDGSEGMLMRFARAIEAKLREKNA